MKSRILLAALVVSTQACTLRIPGISLVGGTSSQSAASSSSQAATSSSSSTSSPGSTSSQRSTAAADDPQAKAGAEAKARAERLQQLAVVTTQPTFTPDDSYSLEKVQQAFANVQPGQVLVLKKKSYAHWAPAPDVSIETKRYKGSTPCGKTGLGPFGADYLREESGFGAIRLEYDLCPRSANEPIDYEHLDEGTAGVIWSTTVKTNAGNPIDVRSNFVFITLDGGRYEMSEPHWEESLFEQKLPAAFPTQSRHAFLGRYEFEHLARTGDANAKATTEKLDTVKKAWDACMSPVLDREEAEYAQNAASSVTISQRDGKNSLTAKKFQKIREDTCGKHKAQFTQTLEKALGERERVRMKILADNKAKFAKAP